MCAINKQLCDWLCRPLRGDDEFHQECTGRDPLSDGHSRWWKHQVRRLWSLRGRAVKRWKITVVNWCKGMVNSTLFSELFSPFISKRSLLQVLSMIAHICVLDGEIYCLKVPQRALLLPLGHNLLYSEMSFIHTSNYDVSSLHSFWHHNLIFQMLLNLRGVFSWVHDTVIIQEKT